MRIFFSFCVIIIISFLPAYSQETINQSDSKGKQGIWQETGFADFSYALITYKDNLKHGPLFAYYKNNSLGAKGYFKVNMLNGDNEQYRTSGQLYLKSYFIDGLLNGTRETYHENGSLQIWYETKNGKPHGLYKFFHENGRIALTGIPQGR